MRSIDYRNRKKIRPGQIKNPSRYVMGVLHPHRRPVEVPLSQEEEDRPDTRGLTTE
jgi:hypothetical protein